MPNIIGFNSNHLLSCFNKKYSTVATNPYHILSNIRDYDIPPKNRDRNPVIPISDFIENRIVLDFEDLYLKFMVLFINIDEVVCM